jgi:hypothetical protein
MAVVVDAAVTGNWPIVLVLLLVLGSAALRFGPKDFLAGLSQAQQTALAAATLVAIAVGVRVLGGSYIALAATGAGAGVAVIRLGLVLRREGWSKQHAAEAEGSDAPRPSRR